MIKLKPQIKLLSSNSDLMSKIGENAKNNAKSFSWDERVEKIYNHVQNLRK